MNIWICIPTLNRAHLLTDCLASITSLRVSAAFRLSVVLVDNDAGQSAKTIFDKQQSFPFPFHYLHQPHRGLSRARNSGIERMLAEDGDALLFVDDDMRLPPNYVEKLVTDMQRLSADAVRGKMRIVEEGGNIQSSRRASLLSRRDMLPGNGVLVSARVFRELGLRFDERFIGGFEDGDFFYRAHLSGARLYLLEEIYFFEVRPPSRIANANRKNELMGLMAMRRAHVATRKYRGGLWRALRYVCLYGSLLLLHIITRLLSLPFTPRKSINRIQNYSYRLAGLVHGLWSFQIPLEKSDQSDHHQIKQQKKQGSIRKYCRVAGFRYFLPLLIAKIMKKSTIVKVTRPDLKFPFHLRFPSSDIAVYKQIFKSQEYFFNTQDSPKVIIDAGANIGLASIYFANKFPTATIFSIEPEVNNFKILKENVAPYGNIIPIQAALWHENTTLNLFDPGNGEWGFTVRKSSNQSIQPVLGITVDELMAQQGIEYIDILKIDIEGAEWELFQTPPQWLTNIDLIIIELHERLKPGCNRHFYNATNDYGMEWQQGENIYLARQDGCAISPETFA